MEETKFGGSRSRMWCARAMRPKARGLAQHGGPLSWLEERVPSMFWFLYVMNGPCRLPCRAVAAAAQLRAVGISSFCYIVNVHNRPSWLKSRMAGRGRLSIITAPCARVCCWDNYSKHWLPASLENVLRLDRHKSGLLLVSAVKVSARQWRKEKYRARIFLLLRSPRIGIDSKVPIRQPYSYSVPIPHRLFKNFSTGQEITVQCRALQERTWTKGRTGPSRKKSTVQESDGQN